MSNAEHSPTPWREVNEGTDDMPMRAIFSGKIEVAFCCTGAVEQKVEDANAAFVVEATNNHEFLLDQNGKMREELYKWEKWRSVEVPAENVRLRAALELINSYTAHAKSGAWFAIGKIARKALAAASAENERKQ